MIYRRSENWRFANILYSSYLTFYITLLQCWTDDNSTQYAAHILLWYVGMFLPYKYRQKFGTFVHSFRGIHGWIRYAFVRIVWLCWCCHPIIWHFLMLHNLISLHWMKLWCEIWSDLAGRWVWSRARTVRATNDTSAQPLNVSYNITALGTSYITS